MVAEEPKIALNGKYSVSEASRILCINRSTLNRYIKAGAVKCGIRRGNGRRFVTGNEILKVWRLY